MSRSALYATAVAEYVAKHSDADITARLNPYTRLLDAPGNVLLQAASTGLRRDSVANVNQLLTIDEDYLTDRAGQVSRRLMGRVESGLRLVLGLWQPVE